MIQITEIIENVNIGIQEISTPVYIEVSEIQSPGATGAPGADGVTPVKGVDYFDGDKGDTPIAEWAGTSLGFDGDAKVDLKGATGAQGSGVKITPWSAGAYLLNDQVNYLGKDWFAKEATAAGDVPGTSAKWVNRLSGMANGIIASGNVDAVSGGTVYKKLVGDKISYDRDKPLYNFEFGAVATNGILVENTVRARTTLIELVDGVGYSITNNTEISGLLLTVTATYQNGVFVSNLGVVSTIPSVRSYNQIRLNYSLGGANFTQGQIDLMTTNIDVISTAIITKTIKEKIIEVENELLYFNDYQIPIYNFEFGGVTTSNGILSDNIIRARSSLINLIDGLSYTITNNTGISGLIASGFVGYQDGVYVADLLGTLLIPSTRNYNQIIISYSLGGANFTQGQIDLMTTNIDVISTTIYQITLKEELNVIVNLVDSIIDAPKSITAIGDSITWGYAPRNNGVVAFGTQIDSFFKQLSDRKGWTFSNFGISGSTLGDNGTGTNSPYVDRYNSLPDTADIIFVLGGTNDIRKGVPLGALGDTTDLTFYGALNVLALGLINKYQILQGAEIGKTKRIIFCSPIKLLSSGTTLEPNFNLWVKAVKEVAEAYSLEFLDLYNLSNINPHIFQTVVGFEGGYLGNYNPYITDGTHPTIEGHYIISKVLEKFIG